MKFLPIYPLDCLMLIAAILFLTTLVTIHSTSYIHADFVFVLHHDAHPNKFDDHHPYAYAEANAELADKFATLFNVSSNRSRVAVIGASEYSMSMEDLKPPEYVVIQALTGDFESWKAAFSVPRAISPMVVLPMEDGIRLAREKIFARASDRPKVLVVSSFTDADETHFGDASGEVTKLRRMGVLVLAVVRENKDASQNLYVRSMMNEIFTYESQFRAARDPNEEFRRQFANDLPEWIRERVRERFCDFDAERCFFDPTHGCIKQKYTSKLPLDLGECQADWLSKIDWCGNKEECEKTCDELWRPRVKCTRRRCGGEKFEMKRWGPMRWRQLEYCPKWVNCSTCSALATTTEEEPGSGDIDNGVKSRMLMAGAWEIALIVCFVLYTWQIFLEGVT